MSKNNQASIASAVLIILIPILMIVSGFIVSAIVESMTSADSSWRQLNFVASASIFIGMLALVPCALIAISRARSQHGTENANDLTTSNGTLAVGVHKSWMGRNMVPGIESWGRLQWSNVTNMLTLEIDRPDGSETVFNVNYSDIERADFAYNEITFRVAGKKYQVIAANLGSDIVASSPFASYPFRFLAMAVGAQHFKSEGAASLYNALLAQGVRVTKPSTLKAIISGLAVAFMLLIALWALAVVVIALTS